MVMALHGCQQTHDDVLRDWGLVAAADRHRFILVAPFITSYDGVRNRNCWGFWLEPAPPPGAGRTGGPAPDRARRSRPASASTRAALRHRPVVGWRDGGGAVGHAQRVLRRRRCAAGLPYGETAAAVSFTGCPGYARLRPVGEVLADMRAARDNAYPIPLMVLQNNADCTVVQPAGRHLRDAQLLLTGGAAHNTPAQARAQQRACAPVFGAAFSCQHTLYTADGRPGSRSRVETVFYDGPIATPDPRDTDHGHYWIGGEAGRDGPWAVRRGPAYPEIVWDFFSRHPAQPVASPPTPPPVPCNTVSAAPGAHIRAGRALRSGSFGLRAVAKGDRRDIGFAYDYFFSSVPLYEGPYRLWYAQPPAGCVS
jgi:hypothetical protein